VWQRRFYDFNCSVRFVFWLGHIWPGIWVAWLEKPLRPSAHWDGPLRVSTRWGCHKLDCPLWSCGDSLCWYYYLCRLGHLADEKRITRVGSGKVIEPWVNDSIAIDHV